MVVGWLPYVFMGSQRSLTDFNIEANRISASVGGFVNFGFLNLIFLNCSAMTGRIGCDQTAMTLVKVAGEQESDDKGQ
jgi:hypothetical protein